MATRWFSLRRRLLLPLLAGVSVCWLATLGWSYVDAHHEIDELFDAQLAQTAQAVLAMGKRYPAAVAKRDHDDHDKHDGKKHDDKKHDDRDDGDDGEPEARIHPYQRNIMFQVWHDDGTLALRSTNAPATPLTAADGFSEVSGPAGHWRYFSRWDARHRNQVQVAESHDVRDDLIGHIALRLLLPALFGLPLVGAWVWLATRRGLAPLSIVAGQIAAREPSRLHALEPAQAPEEIRPLVEAINGLFARVEATLEAEHRFTADAAHELRTPLAALDTQAQVALRAQDPEERRRAIEQLRLGVGRATRLVNQLLTLARLDPEKGLQTQPLRLDQLAEEVCAAHGTAALEKDVQLELEASPVTVPGDADMLRILLRNLVDNAVRYTPRGGRILVRVADGALSVTDSGPGIPAAERQRVFHRFHRLAGQETEGSGLGLSIVERIAELHGAAIELTAGDNGVGLMVRVVFSTSAA